MAQYVVVVASTGLSLIVISTRHAWGYPRELDAVSYLDEGLTTCDATDTIPYYGAVPNGIESNFRRRMGGRLGLQSAADIRMSELVIRWTTQDGRPQPYRRPVSLAISRYESVQSHEFA